MTPQTEYQVSRSLAGEAGGSWRLNHERGVSLFMWERRRRCRYRGGREASYCCGGAVRTTFQDRSDSKAIRSFHSDD